MEEVKQELILISAKDMRSISESSNYFKQLVTKMIYDEARMCNDFVVVDTRKVCTKVLKEEIRTLKSEGYKIIEDSNSIKIIW